MNKHKSKNNNRIDKILIIIKHFKNNSHNNKVDKFMGTIIINF